MGLLIYLIGFRAITPTVSSPGVHNEWVPAARWTIALSTIVRKGATQNVTPTPTATFSLKMSRIRLFVSISREMHGNANGGGAELLMWIELFEGEHSIA